MKTMEPKFKMWNHVEPCGTPCFLPGKSMKIPMIWDFYLFFFLSHEDGETMEPQCDWFLMVIQCRHCEAKKKTYQYMKKISLWANHRYHAKYHIPSDGNKNEPITKLLNQGLLKFTHMGTASLSRCFRVFL